MLDKRSFQTVSTPLNIFKNKENIESMLNEILNQFKFDSTHFQQDAPNSIFAGCLMWPHLFPLYASQMYKTILANGIV